MIRVERRDEPPDFEERVRRKGQVWLSNPINRDKSDPQNYWKECSDDVRAMFSERCGYLASYLSSGHVDHFVSWRRCKDAGTHHLAYEWTNYRWLHPQLNSRKGEHDLLDPFDVDDEWFEVDLFSYRLIVHTERIPAARRALVDWTIKRLQLDDGRIAEELREDAVRLFREGTSMREIHRRAPMVARALEKLLSAPSPDAAGARLREDLLRARSNANSSQSAEASSKSRV